MKSLGSILEGVTYQSSSDFDINDIYVDDLQTDSRLVGQNTLFIATIGLTVDSHQFISNAISSGSNVVICNKGQALAAYDDCVFIEVADTKKVVAQICQNFFNRPDQDLCLVGITGTNGKTSSAHFFYQMVQMSGLKCGLLSTIENRIGTAVLASTHTTPDIVSVYRLVREMVDHDCKYAVMEVSSHALDQGRVDGLQFDYAVFTNISHDHLDYHKTFASYLNAKKRLFDGLTADSCAIVNADEKHADFMLQNCKARKLGYAIASQTDIKARILESQLTNQLLRIDGKEVIINVGGRFNVHNLLSGMAILIDQGVKLEDVLLLASRVKPVPGRMQYIKGQKKDIVVLVDYAHTPDALEKALETIRQEQLGSTKLICVIGCGGDRDKAKRPIMAQIAQNNADIVVLTSDNPRSEEPADILDDMYKGISSKEEDRVLINSDRKQAIRTAIKLASKGDVVLIAGKGHEKYQEVKGVRLAFDDLEIAQTLLNA